MSRLPLEEHSERYTSRDPETQRLMATLHPNPRLDGVAADVAQITWVSVQSLVDMLGDGPELHAMLRKMREAKDCGVLQSLEDLGRLP